MKRALLILFSLQLAALAAAAWVFRHALNSDAVAYLQLARHYAAGDFGLAISGHWSPAISWFLAPLLQAGLPPLAAGRGFMIFSAIVFLGGSLRLFRRFHLPAPMQLCGLVVLAALSIPWSVENITPDLLVAGVIALAAAPLADGAWLKSPRAALACGATWGAAFLCKSIALPAGVLTLGLVVAWRWKNFPAERRAVVSRAAAAMAGTFLVAAPWMAVLSAHYGQFTVARSAGYNHALVAPQAGAPLFQLDAGIHAPPAGRITVWEDPVAPRPDWSPLASAANAAWQLKLIAKNLPIAGAMLIGVSLLFPLLLAAAFVRRDENLRLALLPVLVLAGLFLPNFLLWSEQRYFYAAAPLLWVAAAQRFRPHRAALAGMAVCFLLPTALRAGWHLHSVRRTGECGYVLAEKIAEKKLAGVIVGSGRLSGGRLGLNTAFLLQQPWLGDEPAPSAANYLSSGARLLVAVRGSRLAAELDTAPRARNLDAILFADADAAKQFPVQVFEARR